MVLVGDDHLVARPQDLPERLGQHIGVGRSRRTEVDLVCSNTKGFRPSLLGAIHGPPGFGGRRVRRVGLHLGLGVVVGEGLDRLAAGIRAAGVLEEGPLLQLGQRESRKLGTYEINVK